MKAYYTFYLVYIIQNQQKMEVKNPVGWFEIYVDDIERAQKFYENLLQVKLDNLADPNEQSGEILVMRSFPADMSQHGCSGALVHMPGFKAGANSTVIYFHSDDCAIEEGRIESAGGKIFKNKMSIGEYGFICIGTDTEGNMFGVHSLK